MSAITIAAVTPADVQDVSLEPADLLSLAAAGDAAAFDLLYRTLGRACLGLARKIVVDPDLARDVVQETFLHVWANAERYDPTRGSARTWVLTIAHHKAVDCVRREERRRRPQFCNDLLTEIEAPVAAPDEQACRDELHDTVRRMLASLPAGPRRALILAHFGGYTYAEIAVLVGVPLSTVKSRCRVGMATLRQMLTAAGYAEI